MRNTEPGCNSLEEKAGFGGRTDTRRSVTARTAKTADSPSQKQGGSLVNITKNGSGQYPCGFQGSGKRTIDEETGEIDSYELSSNGSESEWKTPFNPSRLRAERWAMKYAAGRLLPGHRIHRCFSHAVPNLERQVLKGKATGKAFYAGFQQCGRIWVCPICAAKITERRRNELVGAVDRAKSLGLQVNLLTLTIPHGMGDDLKDILGRMLKAWHWMTRGRLGETIRRDLGLVGTVRALEVTDAANGFHPHFHALLFLRNAPGNYLTPLQVQTYLLPIWQRAAVKAGLGLPSDARGCKVDDGSKAAKYVSKESKWGLEAELTKGHQKRGKRSSRTPWMLLYDFLEGDKAAGARFQIYAKAFEGKRQLQWSVGLKALLLVDDSTDEEILAAPEDLSSVLMATITAGQWRQIVKARFQSVLLDLAETDPEGFLELLVSMGKTFEAWRDKTELPTDDRQPAC